jgi:hypothetical protein
MERDSLEALRTVQSALRASAAAYGLGPDLGNYDVVIRLTMEFSQFLVDLEGGPVEPAEIRYKCESVFSGTESFCQLSSDYRVMSDEVRTDEWPTVSFAQLRGEFMTKYRRFLEETDFPLRCRLLLDLFKLQLLFTGMAYE